MTTAPSGWIAAPFTDVFDIQGGTQPPKSTFHYSPAPNLVRLLQIRDFGERPVPTYIQNRSSLKLCAEHDILIGRYGASVGRICTGMQGAYNVALAKVIVPDTLDRRFVFWLLRSPVFQEPILQIERSAQNGFNRNDLAVIPVPLPPLAEQRRVVAKLEDLMTHVASVLDHLSRVPVILKGFRQAVLAAACSGRLTEDWRGRTPSPTNGSSEYAEVEPLFDLPPSWQWVSFESVCEEITVGHVGPMAHEYQEAGIPFLRSQNVREFRFDPTGLKYVSRKFHLKLDKSALHPGDVVVVRSGYAGVACVIPEIIPEANCADLVVIRPSTALDPHYACMFINSNAGRAHVDEVKVGIAQSHFNIGAAKRTPLPLPPLAEQQEIVRRISGLFRLADTIEKRTAIATLRASKLPQSILAKAFRGELVPTEAELARREGREYEPASVLLDRIKKKREAEISGKSERKQVRRKVKK